MGRKVGDSGQAVVLDAGQIKRLLRIAGTTNYANRDRAVIVLSYWLGLRVKQFQQMLNHICGSKLRLNKGLKCFSASN